MDFFVMPRAVKEIEDALGEGNGSLFLPGCINKEAERREGLAVDPLGGEDRLHLHNQRPDFTGSTLFEEKPGQIQKVESTVVGAFAGNEKLQSSSKCGDGSSFLAERGGNAGFQPAAASQSRCFLEACC